jgi:predicted TIM-barrel fold metal-dependent hydrolase
LPDGRAHGKDGGAMITDFHAHWIPDALAALLRQRTRPPRIAPDEQGGERFYIHRESLAFGSAFSDLGARLRFMDEHGVGRQLLSLAGLFGIDALPAEESLPLVRLYNDATAAACRAHRGRVVGLAALPLADMTMAVAELTRARRELGFAGAILPCDGFLSAAIVEAMRPLFEAGERLGVHFFLHPGPLPAALAPVTDNPAIRHTTLNVQARISHVMVTLLFTDFLTPYPNVSVHVANLGGMLPFVIERMDHVSRERSPGAPLPSTLLKRVHVDCASLGPRALELAVAVFGADRVVLGTDCPIFSTAYSLGSIAEARISEPDRRRILSGNAEELLARFV